MTSAGTHSAAGPLAMRGVEPERPKTAPVMPAVPEDGSADLRSEEAAKKLDALARDIRSLSFVKRAAPMLTRVLSSKIMLPTLPTKAGGKLSESEAVALSSWMKARRILDLLDPEARLSLCRRVFLEEFQEGEIVFKQGDPPDKFYIIQSGSVAITVQKVEPLPGAPPLVVEPPPRRRRMSMSSSAGDGDTDSVAGDGLEGAPSVPASRRGSLMGAEHPSAAPSRRGSTLGPSRRASLASAGSVPASEKGEHPPTQPPGQQPPGPPGPPGVPRQSSQSQVQLVGVPTLIAVRSAGESFGELALMSSKPRSATVTAQERTVLIAISRADYNACVKAAQEREQEERARFLRRFPMFRRWPEVSLRQVAIFLRVCSFERGQTVVKVGDKADGVHFIREGECRVLMLPDSPNSPRGVQASSPEAPGEAALVPTTGFVLQNPLKPSGSASQRKLLEVSVLTPGEYFGDVEVLEGRPYPYALVVSSATMVTMCFSKADFVRHVGKNRESVKVMEHMDRMRSALRRKRLERMTDTVQSAGVASMLSAGPKRLLAAAAAPTSGSPHAAVAAPAAHVSSAPFVPTPSNLSELRASVGGSGATAALLLTRSVRAVSAVIRGPLNLPLGWQERPDERAMYHRARMLAAPRRHARPSSPGRPGSPTGLRPSFHHPGHDRAMASVNGTASLRRPGSSLSGPARASSSLSGPIRPTSSLSTPARPNSPLRGR